MFKLFIFFVFLFVGITLNVSAKQACNVINNVNDLYKKIAQLNNNKQPGNICLADGYYHLTETLLILAPNISIRSESNNPKKVILFGNGMQATPQVDNLIWVAASNFSLTAVTLEQAGNHLIQVAGELGVDNFTLTHSILRNSYEQLLKVSRGKNPGRLSNNGVISHCIFEYTDDIGPNWYIGGIDVHHGSNWQIVNNAFFNISSPAKHIAEHAIHLWSESDNAVIKNNFIANSDRGIGLGLGESKHFGGIIANNFIYHNQPQNPYADTGIILESTNNVDVLNNTIWLKTNYPRAIEIRFQSEQQNTVSNNLSNKRIGIRNNGNAKFNKNKQHRKDAVLLKSLHNFIKSHPLKSEILSRFEHNSDFY